MLLDFIILDATDGERSIDDVMHLLYQKYLAKPEVGFTEKEIQETFETIANQSLQTFFDDFIYGIERINIETYFEKIGIYLKNITVENNIYLGLETQYRERKLVITKLEKGFGAYIGGLNVEDEIIAIDNFRVTEDFKKIYEHKTVAETIDVLVSRKGILKSIKIELTNDKKVNYKLEKMENSSEKQQKLLKKWLLLT